MPTSGSVVAFGQSLPIYADRGAISNTLSASFYHSVTDNGIGASKIYVNAINGLNDDDVRLSKKVSLSTRRLRGLKEEK